MFGFGETKTNTLPIKGKAKFYIDGPIAELRINYLYFHTQTLKNKCFHKSMNLFTDIDTTYPASKKITSLDKLLNSLPNFRIMSPKDPYNLTEKEKDEETGTILDYNPVQATRQNRGKINLMKKCADHRLKRADKYRWYLQQKENHNWVTSSDTMQNINALEDNIFSKLVAPDMNENIEDDVVIVIDTEEPVNETIAIALPSKTLPTTRSTQTIATGTGTGGRKKTKKTKKVRKHQGINQTGGNKGKLKKGYRYSGKKLKSGLPQIIKCKSKKC